MPLRLGGCVSIIPVKSTPRRRQIYGLFIEGHIQADVARILDVSEEAIRKQKEKLVGAKYLKEIGNSGIFERGPMARFFEEAKPISKKIVEDDDAGSMPQPPAQPVDRPPVTTSSLGSTPSPAHVRLEEYDIETLEAHMHGHVVFPIVELGERKAISIAEPGKDAIEVPLFTEPCDLGGEDGYHNNWRWTTELHIPGWEYPITLQLRVTPNKRNLHVYPPRIHLTAADIDAGKDYPVHFFDKEVFGVLDFLERHGSWKFDRIHGSRVGRMVGQVYLAYSNPELTRHLPKNLRGFADFPEAEIDHSKGDTEIEFAQAKISNARFLLTAKESHYELREEIEGIEARIREEEAELAELRLRVTARLKESWQALDSVTEAQSRIMEYQRLEMQRKGGPTAPKDPAIAALEDEVMFG